MQRYNPADEWKRLLAANSDAYAYSCRSLGDLRRLKKFPRVWRTILRLTGLRPPARCFEVGCGGGIHLVRLALNGFRCVGLDVSPEVLERAKRFIESVQRFDQRVSSIQLLDGNFLGIELSDLEASFDLVFNFGVIEHYLSRKDRVEFLRRKFLLAKSGGVVVSVVPSGMHPYRKEQKEIGWGGYVVPEVDYTPDLLLQEMIEAGAQRAVVVPHNVMGYLPARRNTLGSKLTYFVGQILCLALPNDIKARYAYSFIAIGWK